ncbi:MAG TPA: hypothetical protein DCS37_04405 [Clostridiales bacterium]|nr:hypothetical protein [Clostridiales bacterium]
MRVKNSNNSKACFKQAWKYFFDKGAYLMLMSVAPALLLPFLLSPSSTLYYLFDYTTINPSNFADMYVAMRELPFSYWYLGLIGLALLVFFVAIMYGVIDTHMRIGVFTIAPNRVKTRLNFNLLTSLLFCLLAFCSFEIFNLLATVLYYLWWVTFKSRVTWLVFSSLTLVIMQLSMILIMSIVILWPPYCLHTGLPKKAALRQAVRSMSGRIANTFFTLLLCILPVEICMIVTGALKCGVIAEVLLDAIAYLYVVPFYITLMYNLFYEVTGTERMDLEKKKKDIWSK